MTYPSWVALHGMAHSFIELDKAVIQVSVWLVFCDFGFHPVCPLMDKNKRLVEASWWESLAVGESGFVLMGRARLSKSLLQFSVNGHGCVPLLLSDLRPSYSRGNGGDGNLRRKDFFVHCFMQCPWPRSRLLLTHASAGDSWTLIGRSGSVSCVVTAPFSWVLVCTRFCLCPPESLFPQFCGSSVIKSHWPPKSSSLGVSVPLPDPQVVGPKTFSTVREFLWYNCSVLNLSVCGKLSIEKN